jgi:hypothetical protein
MNTFMRSTTLVAALVLQITAAQAANLVQNPDFDSDISGWTSGPGITWDSSNGSPGLGSLHISNELNFSTFSMCMVISAPQNIDLFAEMRLVWGSYVVIQGLAYSDTNCSSYIDYFATTARSGPSINGWMKASAINVALPAGTQSVALAFSVQPDSSGPPDGNLDHVIFGPTDVIFRDGFE